MPTLAIDVREACRPVRTGKGQWTYGLVSEFIHEEKSLILFTDNEVPEAWKNAENIVVKKYSAGWKFHISVAFFLLLKKSSVIFLSPLSYIVPALIGRFVNTVMVVHDLIAFHDDAHQKKARVIERLLLLPAAKSAVAVCTVSDSTKADLLERFPILPPLKIFSVFAGPAKPNPPLSTPDNKTIVCIATLSPRKNQLRLIQAFALLPVDVREQHQLLLAGGRGWDDEEIVSTAGLTPNVKYLGAVNDEKYDELLQSATVLALPSLYEGFGMQVLDALLRGVPVLTSERGSLPEVCGDAAEYVDPLSVDGINEGLLKLLQSPQYRAEMREKGLIQAKKYSWCDTARRVWDTLPA